MNDETKFLQQLNQYKTVANSCLHKSTRSCLDIIQRQLKRRYKFLNGLLNVKNTDPRKKNLLDFINKRNRQYQNLPCDWQRSEQELNDIRLLVKNGDLSKIQFAKRTPKQIKDSQNPAGKYDLSFDQKDAINAVVDGVKRYLRSGRKNGCLEMI